MILTVHHRNEPEPNEPRLYSRSRIRLIAGTWAQRPQYKAVILDRVVCHTLDELRATMLIMGIIDDIKKINHFDVSHSTW